jgi:hypothetical protein
MSWARGRWWCWTTSTGVATCSPSFPRSVEIHYQSTSMDDPSFGRGLGTTFMKGGLALNNPTSTKQAVTSASGLLVVTNPTAATGRP